MFDELAQLQERKRSLLIASRLQRQTLATDLGTLRASTGRFDRGAVLLQHAGPILVPVAAALGLVAARKSKGAGEKESLWRRLIAVAKAASVGWGAWKAIRSKR